MFVTGEKREKGEGDETNNDLNFHGLLGLYYRR